MRKVIHGNKVRTLASKSIKIQKTLGKIVIDNNQKVTWIFFYYQLSKLHQGEAKTLKFYKPCERFDIILLLRRNRRKFISSQSFSCIYWSQTKRRQGVAGNMVWVFLKIYFAVCKIYKHCTHKCLHTWITLVSLSWHGFDFDLFRPVKHNWHKMWRSDKK